MRAKKLNTDTNVPVAFYYCFGWGGDVKYEYAWIFEKSERVLAAVRPPNIDLRRPLREAYVAVTSKGRLA